MAELFADDFEVALTASVLTTDTSFSVSASAPVELRGGQFRMVARDGAGAGEIVLVTATAAAGASPWTVTREVEGPHAAYAHASGTVFEHLVTAGVLTNHEKRLSSVESWVFDIRDYGAVSDGVTDDTAAVQATVAAAKAAGAGGVVLFPPGVTIMATGGINLDSTTGITLKSMQGARPANFVSIGNNTPRTELRYTASGSADFISAQASDGFHIEGMAIRYSSATYTGYLIRLDGGGTPTYEFTATNCLFAGANATAVNASRLLHCAGGVEFHFLNCNFERAVIGVYGRNAGGYSNAIHFTSCHFAGLTTAVRNPYAHWQFTACTFEPGVMTQSGAVSPIYAEDGTPIYSVSFTGCGWWDGTGGGAWIDVCGQGLTLTGCYWEPQGGSNEQLVRVRTFAANPNFDGLNIVGLTGHSPGGTAGAKVVTWTKTTSEQTLTNLNLQGLALSPSGYVSDGIDELSGQVSFAPGAGADRQVVQGVVTGTVALGRARAQRVTLGGNITITLPTVGAGVRTKIELVVQQDVTGSRTVTWPASVAWAGGSAPTLSTTAYRMDVIQLSTDDGVTWTGTVEAANVTGPTLPGAPTVTANGGASSGAIVLTWAAPTANGAAITDYLIQWRPTSGGAWTTFVHPKSAGRRYTMTGFANGTSYDIQVASISAVGTGAFSSVVAVTPTATYNPLAALAWEAAYWASDPAWTPPASGSGVSSWRDGSGNVRTLTQATGAKQPLYQSSIAALNSKPAVQFDGSNDSMFSPSFALAQTYTAVLVLGDPVGTAGGARLLCSQDSAMQLMAMVADWTGYAGSLVSFGTVGSGGRYVACVFAGASGVGISGTGSTTANFGTGAIGGGISLGARGDDSLFGAAKVAFAGVYAGDIRDDSIAYAAFKSWVTSNYGVTA